jgi:hypothetical protein
MKKWLLGIMLVAALTGLKGDNTAKYGYEEGPGPHIAPAYIVYEEGPGPAPLLLAHDIGPEPRIAQIYLAYEVGTDPLVAQTNG